MARNRQQLGVVQNPRKKLAMSDDEFFVACALSFGRPVWPPPAQYNKPGGTRFERGFQCWLHDTEKGKLWLKIVTESGEAKRRAGKLYYRYCQWVKHHDDHRPNE